MDAAVAVLAGGLMMQLFLAAFLVAFYRLAGLQPTRYEKRRWAFLGGWVVLLIAVFAGALAAGADLVWAFAASVLLVGLPVMVASYALRGRHWLFPLAPDEIPMLEARREAMRAARRRPAFWLMLALLLLVAPVVSIATMLIVVRA